MIPIGYVILFTWCNSFLFYPLFIITTLEDPVHVNSRGMNLVRVQFPIR